MLRVAHPQAWLDGHPRLLDGVLVAAVLALFEMPAFDPYRHDSPQWWPVWGFAVAVPLLWRRSRPVLAPAVALAGSAAALLTRSGPNWGALSQATLFVGPAVALAGAGTLLPRRTSTRLVVAAGAAVVPATAFADSAPDALVAQLTVLFAAWIAGEALRARRHEIALLRELVDTRSAQAADAERARIARELHDVIAHQLAVIAIQAGAARLAPGADGPTRQALSTVEEASHAALADIRRVLGVLHRPDQTGGITAPPRLDRLDQLAGRLREAGLPLEVSTTGNVAALPPALDVSSYRIVQEALTNVLKHAGPVGTRVTVTRTPDRLELDIRNDPPGRIGRPHPEGGRGLVGMRERVAVWHGALDAGPLPNGGFAVTARIPLT